MKKLYKVLTAVLAAVMCFAILGCSKKGGSEITYSERFPDDFDKSFLVTSQKEFAYDETDGGKRALLLYEKLHKIYYRTEADFPWRLGYYESKGNNSFVWDYGALFTMMNAVCRANPDDAGAKAQLKDIADTLERYYLPFDNTRVADRSLWEKGIEGNMLSDEFIDLAVRMMKITGNQDDDGKVRYRMPVRIYSSGVGGGDPYYDDNVWLVMALLEAGKILGEAKYIERAEDCLMYVLSGWDISAGGGLRWKESFSTKNTCSNGPAAMACFDFYHYYDGLTPQNDEERALYADKKSFYLQFGKYIYDWTKSVLMDQVDGTYEDRITLLDNDTYRVERGKLTYTSGTMLSSAVRLYEITQDETYKADAEKTLRGSYQTFVSRDRFYAPGIDLYPVSDGWFHVYLVRGYLDFARVFGNDAYLKKMADTMDFAYKNARNYYGLIQNDWSGRDQSADAHYNVLELRNAAAPIEVIALLDAWFDAHPNQTA